MPRGSQRRYQQQVARTSPESVQKQIDSVNAQLKELSKVKGSARNFNQLDNLRQMATYKLRDLNQKRVGSRGKAELDRQKKQAQANYDSIMAKYRIAEEAKKARDARQGLSRQLQSLTQLQKDVSNYQAGQRKQEQQRLAREATAQRAIDNAIKSGNTNALRKAGWDYRNTQAGSKIFSQFTTKAVNQKLALAKRSSKGSSINRATSNAEILYFGGTQKYFDDLVRWEDQNRKIAKRQSAGLRAGGVKQNFSNPMFSAKPMPNSANSFMKPSTKSNMSSTATSTTRVTSTDPATAKANAEQQAYVASLRAGGVGIAEALLNPKTPQRYYKGGKEVTRDQTSINLERFLTERGYDISKPELIPNSVFKPEKQLQARAQARSSGTMGDLREKANTYQTTSPQVLAQRQEIRDFFAPEVITTQTVSNPQGQVLARNIQQFANPNSQGVGGFTFGGQPLVQAPTPTKNQLPNYSLMPQRPLTLASYAEKPSIKVDQWGVPYTDPVSSFFGAVAKGANRTFQSNINQVRNVGEFITGQELTPLPASQTPVQDSFFGAVGDSAKNFFYGDQVRQQEGRAKDPLGNFFATQSKRNPVEVGSEIFTEGLLWAIPVAPAVKGAQTLAKVVTSGARANKVNNTLKGANIATSPKTDAINRELAKDTASSGNIITNFFGGVKPKAPSKPATPATPTTASSKTVTSFFDSVDSKITWTDTISLGKGKGKTGSASNKGGGFFGGGSGGAKSKPTNFIDPPKGNKVNPDGTIVLTKQKQIPATQNFFKSYPVQLGKAKGSVKAKVKPKQQTKTLTKQKPKQQQDIITGFFKPTKVKPIFRPAQTIKQINKQRQRQRQDVIPIIRTNPQTGTRTIPRTTPRQKTSDSTRTTTGFFIPPPVPPTTTRPPIGLRFFGGGGSGRGRSGLRRGQRINTAWNVDVNTVGGFFKGASFRQSWSDYAFKDLDKKTATARKASKKKGKDAIDTFFNL